MEAPSDISLALQEPNQLADYAPWRMDFRQISPGSGRTDVQVRFGRSITALSIEMEARVHQTGEAPAGVITLGVPKSGTIRNWLGTEMPEHAMILFGAGQEFDGVSDPGFKGVTVSILQPFLDALAEDFGLASPERVLKRGVLNLAALPRRSRLFVRKTEQFLNSRVAPHSSDREDDIGLALLLAASNTTALECVSSSRFRDRVLKRAISLIEASPEDPPSIRDLCVQSGGSWPTLHRAFVERFGLGPKAYLMQLRMSRVRRDLISAPPGTRVSDVANRWGYWHLGQFAADYRRLFSRLPSQDLSSNG